MNDLTKKLVRQARSANHRAIRARREMRKAEYASGEYSFFRAEAAFERGIMIGFRESARMARWES